MSYQVLARKWRPKTFAEMVGQQHVLKALINALQHDRLHHAYLFTGTRGVGKTTVARIFAKSLNCEKGVSAEPCGQCSACVAVDEGRFVDLIEVDAASRTKVEDTRELLENVQYAPTAGRYKVYLIDEVHMLSNHSFNALLKTLEEPPPHVKFLLATTDPQKLPVTILSRCLQFNLKNMTSEQIVGYLKEILQKENVSFDDGALWQLGRAADGSMRDALSLTDQAIAYGEGHITSDQVSAMLGTMDRNQVFGLLEALVGKDPSRVLAQINQAAEFSPDFQALMTELLSLLHRVAIAQVVPDAVDNSEGDRDRVLAIASASSPEDIQLFYQVGLTARKDMALAPDLKSGFEMAVLRMLVFSPEPVSGNKPPIASGGGAQSAPETSRNSDSGTPASTDFSAQEPAASEVSNPPAEATVDRNVSSEPAASVQVPVDNDPIATSAVVANPVEQERPAVETQQQPEPEFSQADVERPYSEPAINSQADVSQTMASVTTESAASHAINAAALAELNKAELVEQDSPEPAVEPKQSSHSAVPVLSGLDAHTWAEQFWQLGLSGIHESLFGHSQWQSLESGKLTLRLGSEQTILFQTRHTEPLLQSLKQAGLNVDVIDVEFGDLDQETPFQFRARQQQERRDQAVEMLKQDPMVNALMHELDAVLDETSVQPVSH